MGMEPLDLRKKEAARIGRRSVCDGEMALLAVRVGFEPTEPVKAQRFSRPPD